MTGLWPAASSELLQPIRQQELLVRLVRFMRGRDPELNDGMGSPMPRAHLAAKGFPRASRGAAGPDGRRPDDGDVVQGLDQLVAAHRGACGEAGRTACWVIRLVVLSSTAASTPGVWF